MRKVTLTRTALAMGVANLATTLTSSYPRGTFQHALLELARAPAPVISRHSAMPWLQDLTADDDDDDDDAAVDDCMLESFFKAGSYIRDMFAIFSVMH